MRVLVCCEARADFETATALIDRVLGDHASWIADLLADPREDVRAGIRAWVSDGPTPFFDIHQVNVRARQRALRRPQGHFGGRPGESGALMARTLFLLAREEHRTDPPDALVLVWDADGDAVNRRVGLKQAREEAAAMPFTIVFGVADRMREAWVLAGFDPQDDAERATLTAETKALGFPPNQHAHRLQDSAEDAPRNAKRVLRTLTRSDRDRQARCSTEPALSTLRDRGADSGLVAFLDEVVTHLVPLLAPGPRTPAPTQA